MTRHFVDIGLRGDEETPLHAVRDAVFGRLHRAFALPNVGVGISFPRLATPGPYLAGALLGDLLRLHGREDALASVLATDWSTNLVDYVSVSPIRPAPADSDQVRLVRVQAKSNTARLVRRAMKRHGLTEDRAREKYREHAPDRVNLPYLVVRSASTRQSFRLYLRQEPADTPTEGAFSTYGLSARGGPTVPLF